MGTRRRRLVWGVAAAVVAAVIIAAWLRERGGAPKAPEAVSEAPSGALDVRDLQSSRGVPLRVEPPGRPPLEIEPPTLRVVPAAPDLPAPADIADPLPLRPSPPAVDLDAPLEIARGGGGAAAASDDSPVDPFLRLRTYVHPEVPARVVAKRRIDGAVTLQVKVGTDGRVQDVRVLQSIPNCEECNQNAVAAARRFVYEAPVGGAVWAAPVEMQFRHGRGR